MEGLGELKCHIYIYIWGFPKMVVHPKHPKMIMLKEGYHHFRTPPYIYIYNIHPWKFFHASPVQITQLKSPSLKSTLHFSRFLAVKQTFLGEPPVFFRRSKIPRIFLHFFATGHTNECTLWLSVPRQISGLKKTLRIVVTWSHEESMMNQSYEASMGRTLYLPTWKPYFYH